MANTNDIESALRSKVFELISQDKVKVENVAFNPEGLPLWVELKFLPGDTSVDTLGARGKDLHVGLFLVEINVPLGKGSGNSNDLLQSLRSSFTPGVNLTYSSAKVRIRGGAEKPGRGNAAHPSFYKYTFSITWQSRFQREAI